MISHILLTGATGLIGRNLLQALLDVNSARHVSVILRRPHRLAISSDRVSVLHGDISVPRFGLSKVCWDALSHSITEVIHCAADVRFGLPIDEARRVNVTGTVTVLEFARTCRQLRALVHISSVYVMGRDQGMLAEAPYANTCGFFNTYEQTKYEAEQRVVQAARSLPVSIFRLSSVVGDSVTGRVDQFNHFHQLLRLVPRSSVEMIPGIPDALMDFISTDWAVAALSTLYEAHLVPGEIYNICAGPEHSLPLFELVETAFHRLGRTRRPRLAPMAEFEAYIAKTLRTGDGVLRSVLQPLSYFLPHLAIRQSFENQRTLALLRTSGIAPPDSRTLFQRVLEYCEKSRPSGTSAPIGSVTPPSSTASEA